MAKESMILLGGQNMAFWPTCLKDVPSVFSDPTAVDGRFHFDDSNGRGTSWGLAASSMGTALKRLGEVFGVPDNQDPTSVMSDGASLINRAFTLCEPSCKQHPDILHFGPDEIARWDRESAAALSRSSWFKPDGT
jgi:hypothetical protein